MNAGYVQRGDLLNVDLLTVREVIKFAALLRFSLHILFALIHQPHAVIKAHGYGFDTLLEEYISSHSTHSF